MHSIDQALLDCLRDPADAADWNDRRLLSPSDWDRLVERARFHHVVPLVYRRVRQAPDGVVSPAALEALRSRTHRVAFQNLRLFAELRSVLTSFAEARLPVMLLKGAYVAPEVYGGLALREMCDVDLLVRKSDLAEGIRLLLGAGFRPQTELPEDIVERVMRTLHVPALVKSGVGIELHWTIFPSDRPTTAALDGLWDRAIPVTVNGAEALAPALEDLLLHTCAHAAYRHGFEFGLRPYCDLRFILKKQSGEVRWSDLLDRARSVGWSRGVRLALLLSHRLVGASIPEDVLDQAAEEVPAELAGIAAELVLANPRSTRRLTASLIEWQHLGYRERLRLLWERLRWHPLHVDPSLGYFLRRGVALVRRHLPIVLELSRGEHATKLLATRKRRLDRWLTVSGVAR